MPADEKGMRIAVLDEMSYRYEMWVHEPIQDFWRVGRGCTKKLMPQAYTPWGISQDILSAKEERISYISFLASMQSY